MTTIQYATLPQCLQDGWNSYPPDADDWDKEFYDRCTAAMLSAFEEKIAPFFVVGNEIQGEIKIVDALPEDRKREIWEFIDSFRYGEPREFMADMEPICEKIFQDMPDEVGE